MEPTLSGTACRMLAKQVQTELALANAVADEVLATMTTVRAHAADDSAKAAYAVKLAKFYVLQVHLKYSATWHMCALHVLSIAILADVSQRKQGQSHSQTISLLPVMFALPVSFKVSLQCGS